jgi:hypothetical protein
MGEGKEERAKSFDPYEPLRGMRDAYLDAMAKSMVEAVNTEGYAQATGAMLDNYLTASAPFREALEKSMVQALQQLSLPSRQEIAVLADRFTNLEMRLDDLDAKLDQIAKLSATAQPVVRPEPIKPARETLPKEPLKPASAKAPAAAKRSAKREQKSPRKRSSRKSGR